MSSSFTLYVNEVDLREIAVADGRGDLEEIAGRTAELAQLGTLQEIGDFVDLRVDLLELRGDVGHVLLSHGHGEERERRGPTALSFETWTTLPWPWTCFVAESTTFKPVPARLRLHQLHPVPCASPAAVPG